MGSSTFLEASFLNFSVASGVPSRSAMPLATTDSERTSKRENFRDELPQLTTKTWSAAPVSPVTLDMVFFFALFATSSGEQLSAGALTTRRQLAWMRHVLRLEDVIKLGLGEQIFLEHKLVDAAVGFKSFLGDSRAFLVAEHRI